MHPVECRGNSVGWRDVHPWVGIRGVSSVRDFENTQHYRLEGSYKTTSTQNVLFCAPQISSDQTTSPRGLAGIGLSIYVWVWGSAEVFPPKPKLARRNRNMLRGDQTWAWVTNNTQMFGFVITSPLLKIEPPTLSQRRCVSGLGWQSFETNFPTPARLHWTGGYTYVP